MEDRPDDTPQRRSIPREESTKSLDVDDAAYNAQEIYQSVEQSDDDLPLHAGQTSDPLSQEGIDQTAPEPIEDDDDEIETIELAEDPVKRDTTTAKAQSPPAKESEEKSSAAAVHGEAAEEAKYREQVTAKDEDVKVPESTREILSLYAQANARVMSVLRDFHWPGMWNQDAVAIDDSVLWLALWTHEAGLHEGLSALQDREYDPYLFDTDRFGLLDVLQQAREVSKLVQAKELPELLTLKYAVQSLERAVKSLTSSRAAHRAILDPDGEVAALRARLRAVEDGLNSDIDLNHAPISPALPGVDHASAVADDGDDKTDTPSADIPKENVEEHGPAVSDEVVFQEQEPPIDWQEVIRSRVRQGILNVVDDLMEEMFKPGHKRSKSPLPDLPDIEPLISRKLDSHGEIADIDERLAKLEGLPLNDIGEILNDDGDGIGRVVEGEKKLLQGYAPNNGGEILDDNGDLVGRVGAV